LPRLQRAKRSNERSGQCEGGLRRVDRDQRLRELVLARNDVTPVALQLAGLGSACAQLLAMLDEHRDLTLEGFDAGVCLCHDSTYDARMRTLAAPKRRKSVSAESEGGRGRPPKGGGLLRDSLHDAPRPFLVAGSGDVCLGD